MNKERLYAGAVKRAITPTAEELAGFATFAGSYDGTRGDIYARVIVLGNETDKLVIIASDLYSLPEIELSDSIGEEYDLDMDNLFFCGTQNYMAMLPEGGEWFDRTINIITDAVGEAIEKMVPAKIGYGVGTSDINTDPAWLTPSGLLCGTNMQGWADKEMPVLKIVAEDDTPIAALVNYSMQASVLAGNFIYTHKFNKVCGDIAGEISDFVEKAVGGDFVCAWAIAGGDLMPLMTSQRMEPVMNEDGTFEPVERCNKFLTPEASDMIMHYLASTQALDVLRTLEEIRFYQDEFVLETYSDEVNVFGVTGWQDQEDPDVLLELIEGNEYEFDPEMEDGDIFPQLAVINDSIAIASADAVVSASIAESIREALPFDTLFLGTSGEALIKVDTDEAESDIEDSFFMMCMGLDMGLNDLDLDDLDEYEEFEFEFEEEGDEIDG